MKSSRLETPAGRLLDLLRNYQGIASTELCIVETWATVLDVDLDAAPGRMAELGSIVVDIEYAVIASQNADQLETVNHFAPLWLKPVLLLDYDGYTTPSPGQEIIDPGSIAALAGVAAFLGALYPEGGVPDKEKISQLRAAVVSLIAEIVAENSLSPTVKHLLCDHLHRILRALDHIWIGGPGAVSRACEQLVGQVALHGEEVRASSGDQLNVWRRVVSVAGSIYAAFKRAPETRDALNAVTEIIGELH